VFDTNLVVCGNVLTAPEWRRISSTGALMANFRVTSTSRRYERETGRWVDGNNLRLRVTAWRKLAEGVASSIAVGDPVIVYGRLYTRDWKDDNDNPRVSYEVEAFSIGHDLSKGRAKFFRTRNGGSTSEIADADGDSSIGGEVSVPLTADEAPVGYGDGLPQRLPDEDEPTFQEVVAGLSPAEDPGKPAQGTAERAQDIAERAQDIAEPAEDELTLEVRRLTEAPPEGTRRTRRGGTKREPVPA
jgi:single-strand DNA-binding protein